MQCALERREEAPSRQEQLVQCALERREEPLERLEPLLEHALAVAVPGRWLGPLEPLERPMTAYPPQWRALERREEPLERLEPLLTPACCAPGLPAIPPTAVPPAWWLWLRVGAGAGSASGAWAALMAALQGAGAA